MNFLTTILAFAVTLGILIIIHEFGHYWMAKRFGVKVLKFSIGFGKPIFTWKRNETEWSISAIPLGGYVRMLDMRDSDCEPISPEDRSRTFNVKPAWQRLFIVLAGPVANLVLAVFLYTVIAFVGTNEPLPIVKDPEFNTPAYVAGIRDGDHILSVSGKPVKSFGDMHMEIVRNMGSRAFVLLKDRSGNEREVILDLSDIYSESSDAQTDPVNHIGLDLRIGSPIIVGFIENSIGKQKGLKVNDEILLVNGQPVNNPKAFVSEIQKSVGKEVSLVVRNKADSIERVVQLVPTTVTTPEGQVVGRIGASIGVDIPMTIVSYGPFESLWKGFTKVADMAWFSVEMVCKMISGEVSVKNISGPVTIADYAGQTVKLGFMAFISFLALISVNLGVLNLLPIPMLDGCHVLYYSVEMVRGKPVSENFQLVASKLGMAVIACLTLLALYNDLTRLLP
ncbi:MAG: RIP metalloprotease RseP [Burkholderiaceae bacterium]|nr:RIP metalloprotease RseP [Burkholderiaceae bacterium]